MKKKTYRIKSSILYALIIFIMLLMVILFYRSNLYELWKEKNGMETIEYSELESKLKIQDNCYLCGNNDMSLINYYHKKGEIGIIYLSNWYVTDFRLKPQDDIQTSGVSSVRTNMDGISISTDAIPSRGIVSTIVDFTEGEHIDFEMLKDNLCQSCLNKIADVLKYNKWKVECKEPIPLCLIDFQTLDLYSLQYVSSKYSIRDYWIVVLQNEKEIIIDAYYLPYD